MAPMACGPMDEKESVARDRLDTVDVAALDVLLDTTGSRGLARRPDLTLRTTQKSWAGQRLPSDLTPVPV